MRRAAAPGPLRWGRGADLGTIGHRHPCPFPFGLDAIPSYNTCEHRGRRMNTHLMICLVTAALLPIGYEVPAGTEIITLEPKFGTVTFSHKAHSSLDEVECRTCHHTHAGGATPIQPCHHCHVARHFSVAAIRPESEPQSGHEPGKPPTAQEAFHALCHGCHAEKKEAGQTTGPTDSCRDCHV